MLEVFNLVGVRGERRLFDCLNFQITAGGCLSVQGENGSGKTTLLRMLAGITKPVAGTIHWKGQPLDQQSNEYHRDVLYCGHAVGLKDDLDATENLQIMAALAGVSITRADVREALRKVGLTGCESLPVHALSQGQKRRVSLTRLLLQPSVLWILDEPLTALDRAAVEWLGNAIDQHLHRGGMVVLTSHQHLPLVSTSHTIRLAHEHAI